MSTSELKSKLTQMLEWFHNFCEENDLCYYALGGTMLGAVRHNGFIPWDDDIDVGMPREDYERLESLLSGKDGKYVLETPNTPAKDYFYPFSKIYDTDTTLVENTGIKIKRGIYIDIFPLDGIGNSCEESKENYAAIQKKYNLLLARTGGIRRGRKFYKNAAVALFKLVPPCILKKKELLLDLANACKAHDYADCTWCGNLVGAWRFKEVMPKSVMGEPKLYKFEGLDIYGAQDADAYLTSLYGDWRQLPPEDKRVTHHDYVMLDLNSPYIEK